MEVHGSVRDAVLNGHVRFTAHALKRCRDRGIAPEEVLFILADNPAHLDDHDRAQFITWGDYDSRRFRIVSRPVEPFLLIITVIHER